MGISSIRGFRVRRTRPFSVIFSTPTCNHHHCLLCFVCLFGLLQAISVAGLLSGNLDALLLTRQAKPKLATDIKSSFPLSAWKRAFAGKLALVTITDSEDQDSIR